MKQKILILQGLPSSGKSTFARELMAKEPSKWKRINKDLLREMLDFSIWNEKNEKIILHARNNFIYEFIRDGYNVIVDDTNFSPNHINIIKVIAATLEEVDHIKVEIEVKFINTPLYECIKRDELRGEKSVGKKVILNMYNQYLKKPPVENDVKGLPYCVISDIDGTLAYTNGRSYYDYTKVASDLPNKKLIKILKSLKYTESIDLFIFTGRKPSCRVETGTWLYDNGIDFYKELVMRKSEDDNRPDEIIKEEMYNEHIKGKYNVLCVFDDRPKVIRMWKKLGLFICDVNRQDSRMDF